MNRIHTHAYALLAASAGQQTTTRLEDVLVQAAAGIEDAELFADVPQSRTWEVKEAAHCLLLCADPHHPARLTDTGLLDQLTALDQLPYAERTTLVAEAVRRIATRPVATLNLPPSTGPTRPTPPSTLLHLCMRHGRVLRRVLPCGLHQVCRGAGTVERWSPLMGKACSLVGSRVPMGGTAGVVGVAVEGAALRNQIE
ncbi:MULTISPECIES: hypothetical protein [unclassified Streptomyces]|uniref:hypothetical protein n=1 Tax=unclassified Streptomyces TaxID=2593676 RepID=UPI0033FDAEDB